MQRLSFAVAATVALAFVALGVATFWIYGELRGNLPTLNGTRTLAGMHAPVVVERDELDHGACARSGSNQRRMASFSSRG